MEQEEIARQKRAGTYLTPEQKEALARSQRALEIMKAQGNAKYLINNSSDHKACS